MAGSKQMLPTTGEVAIFISREPSILLERIHGQSDLDENVANMMTTTTGGNVPIMVDEDSCSSSRDLESSGKVNHLTMKKTDPQKTKDKSSM
jgi:hypothetical protein